MKLVKEILIIVVVSSAIGLIYNFQKEKPLTMIYEPKKFDEVSDDELFGSNDIIDESKKNKAVQADSNVIESQNKTKDSIKKEEINDNEDNLKIKKENNKQNKDITKKISDDKNEKTSLDLSSKSSNIHDRTITFEQMLKILEMGEKFIIIDARNHEQFKEDKIGNAINIFPYNPDMDEIANKILGLPLDKTLIIYCDGGECDSSHKLADLMTDFGYSDIYIYTGGWEEWINKRSLYNK